LSTPRVCGSFSVMAATNRAVVHRTWGLHELEARRLSINANTNDVNKPNDEARQQRLTYGPQFKYGEFVIKPNAVVAVLSTIFFAVMLVALKFILL
jgi:hypothetical protein